MTDAPTPAQARFLRALLDGPTVAVFRGSMIHIGETRHRTSAVSVAWRRNWFVGEHEGGMLTYIYTLTPAGHAALEACPKETT